MAEAMAVAPQRMLRLAGQLAASQAALHRVPVPGWAGTAGQWSLAGSRLRLARRVAASGSAAGRAQALERTERILPLLEVPRPVICHGDFQPANLLLDAGTVWVIDWTDAGIGDPHGDIARTAWLFRFAAAGAPRRQQRLVLRALAPALSRAYLSAYRRAASQIALPLPKTPSVQLMPHGGTREAPHRVGRVVVYQGWRFDQEPRAARAVAGAVGRSRCPDAAGARCRTARTP